MRPRVPGFARLLLALLPFGAGLLFALGLGLAGMTRPAKVIGFLDVFGAWDPSLAFVIAGALLVHLPFVRWRQRARPRAAPVPAAGRIDGSLIVGAALFGIGWGLSGLCPGPAFVSLASGAVGVATFVALMFVGMALARGAPGARL